jgi:hypothetical protein
MKVSLGMLDLLVCDGCQQPCTGVSLQNDGKLNGKLHSGWLCDLCIRGKERKVHFREESIYDSERQCPEKTVDAWAFGGIPIRI